MKNLTLALLLTVSLPAMANVDAGKAKYATCIACHGAQAQGAMGPKLAGKPATEIEKKLTTYKNKGTVGPQSALMWGIAAGLSPEDIKNIAAYTASLK